MELIWARAGHLVRRGWRATVVLALLAGLAAGVAMAVAGAGRRTATVYDRFAAYADPPELIINFCPPGLEEIDEEALQQCFVYDAEEERDVIASLPEVEAAARAEFRGLTIAPATDPDDTSAAVALVMIDPGITGDAGRYRVVEGREVRSGDEVVLNRALVDSAGLSVGDDVVVTFWADDELGAFLEDGSPLHGPSVEVRIVGISRSITDLTAASGGSGPDGSAVVHARPELAARTADAAGFTGVLVEAVGDDAAAAQAAIEQALPDRQFNTSPAVGADEVAPTREAIRYEGQATTTLGLIVAVVAAAFVGQAVARQSRREWRDGPTLRAMGVTTGAAGLAALIRGAAIGVPAAAVSVAVAIALSPAGPIGIGRRAEIDPGIAVDLPVLAIGAAAVLAIPTVAAWGPLVRGRALRAAPASPTRDRAQRTPGLSPVMTAGLHLARTGGRGSVAEVGTALVSAGAAVVALVAAACIVASFDDLSATPARFGAPWDLSVGASIDGSFDVEEMLREAPLGDDVEQAAAITGNDMDVGGQVVWAQAFVPVDGIDRVLPPPIATGRAPVTDREIAVGAVTLRDIGRSIGDSIKVTTVTTGETFEMEIVGTAIINDNFEASPGRGAVVTPGFMKESTPEVTPDPFVVELVPGADAAAVIEQVRGGYDGAVEAPLQQAAVRNLGRIRELPYVMAAIVAVLALASLVHALVLSIGRNRRTLGVLRSIGFTRRQVAGAVAWHATSYAAIALLALPIGIVLGRWGWRFVARALGVPAVPVLPVLAVLAVILALVAIANLAAAYPAWRASRLSTAAALRTE